MKRLNLLLICIMALLSLCLVSCSVKTEVEESIWDNANYKEDTTLGNGKTTVYVEVEAEDKTVTFTLKTDKETLGDALLEHKLVSGENGAYGLYIKKVNGIEADYSKTKAYWSFCKDGESMPHGVDNEKISDGALYQLIYTKE